MHFYGGDAMRRIVALILCIFLFALPVHAANAAESVSTSAVVTENGACQVTMTVRINMDHPVTGLTFPLPRGAKDVAVNGSSARTYSSATDPDAVLTDLSFLDGYMGENTIDRQIFISRNLRSAQELEDVNI